MLKRPVKKKMRPPACVCVWKPSSQIKPSDLLNGASCLHRGIPLPNAVQYK